MLDDFCYFIIIIITIIIIIITVYNIIIILRSHDIFSFWMELCKLPHTSNWICQKITYLQQLLCIPPTLMQAILITW